MYSYMVIHFASAFANDTASFINYIKNCYGNITELTPHCKVKKEGELACREYSFTISITAQDTGQTFLKSTLHITHSIQWKGWNIKLCWRGH